MSALSFHHLGVVAAFLFLVKAVINITRSRRNGPYPPGPPGRFIIGNLLDLHVEDPSRDYAEWSRKYNSDIVFATALGNHLLILNKKEDADELLERRSKLYSDRPYIPMVNLIGWRGMMPLMHYGDYWRLCRKICQQHFNYEASRDYWPHFQEKIHQFMAALLETPEDLDSHNKMLSISFATSIMYGYQVKTTTDPLISAVNESVRLGGGLLTPDGSVINLLPVLGNIPLRFSKFIRSRKLAAEAEKLLIYMQESMKNIAQEAVRAGTATPSLITDYIETRQGLAPREEEERAMWDVALTTYAGATDTTMAVTSTFFYLMAKYPEVQKRAQKEIDQLLGTTRLPTFEDRPYLPYIEAMYREIMRWEQSLPLGCPHAALEDDYYKGYFIPKGTTVLANIWAMTHDEDIYPDPYTFKPERFLDPDGKLNDDDRILAYGFGRRICVGKAVASTNVWFMMASILSAFEISKEKDELGNEMNLDDGYFPEAFFKHKTAYKCSIKARSQLHRDLILGKNSAY